MKKKKHIVPLILLVIGTLLLGVSTLVISLQLQNRQPVTDLPPRAAEDDNKLSAGNNNDNVSDGNSSSSNSCLVQFNVSPLEKCELSFTLPTPTGAPTCGSTCTTDAQCPSNHLCVTTAGEFQNKCVLEACFDDPEACTANRCSIEPTTPVTPICGGPCTTNAQCPTDHRCITTAGEFQNKCVLNACFTDPASCTDNRCDVKPTTTVTPTCGGACTTDAQCPDDHRCVTSSGAFANKCVLNACYEDPASCTTDRCDVKPTTTVTTVAATNTPTTTATKTPTTTASKTPTLASTSTPTNTPAPAQCSASCSSNADCANDLVCSNGMCRNPECTEQPNCACYFVPTPEVPVTGMGTTLAGVGIIAGGILLLLLGLVF